MLTPFFCFSAAVRGQEKTRYKPFILACNTALLKLREKTFPDLRDPSALGILFHASGKETYATYNDGVKTIRKPDFGILSWPTVRSRLGESPPPQATVMTDHALNPPRGDPGLKWPDYLAPGDNKVKVGKTGVTAAPTEMYTNVPMKTKPALAVSQAQAQLSSEPVSSTRMSSPNAVTRVI